MNNNQTLKRIARGALSALVAVSVAAGTLSAPAIHTAAQTVSSDLSQKMDELEKRQKEIQQRLKQTQGDINKQEEYQKQLDEQIDVTQQQITLLNQKIAVTNQKLQDANREIAEKQQQVDKTTQDFQQRMRAMYMSNDPSMLSILLSSQGIGDFLSRLEMVRRVSKHDQDLVDKLKKEKQELQSAKQLVEDEKKELQQSKDSVSFKQKQLDEAYSKSKTATLDLNKLYEQYKANKAEIDKALAQAEQEVQEAIRKAQEEQKRKEEEEKKKQEEENKNNSSGSSGTASGGTSGNTSSGGSSSGDSSSGASGNTDKFAWPVPGYNSYSNYGWRTWPDGSKEFHKGMDISGGGIYGKNIVAADDGEVIVARNWDPGAGSYGKYVMISHSSSLVTLYGHASDVVVKVGQKVKKGQVIAKVGSTGWSTGPHCHFEVRVNGNHTDPLPYLK